MISDTYLEGMQAAIKIWPRPQGEMVKNPYRGSGLYDKEKQFESGFYDTIKTLTVLALMKTKDPAPASERVGSMQVAPVDEFNGLKVGIAVEKTSGYEFPGIVVSLFKTTEGKARAVVELNVPGVGGLLHIYNVEQLKIS